jgi:predicted Zn-dependent peptidase
MDVMVAARAGVPIVEIELQFDAGMAADPGAPLGAASFALDMIDEGTGKRDAAAIRAQLEQLGAELSVRTTLDTSSVVLSALEANLDASLALLSELVRTPAFRDADIERLREERVAAIRREVLEPEGLVQRALPSLLFGAQHPYGAPASGIGTIEGIRELSRTDLLAFQQRWLRPDNAVLLAAGSTTLQKLQPLVERHFGTWTAPAVPRGSKEIPAAPVQDKPRIYLLDRPGAQQSLIVAALLGPPTRDPSDLAVSVVADALGGAFTSRLNQNLREEKGWAYGASLRRTPALGPTVLSAYAPVQTDRTGEAMNEILRELREATSSVPLSDEEIAGIVRRRMRELPGRFETSRAVLRTLSDMARFDRPDDWVETSFARLGALSGDEVRHSAQSVLRPEEITWLIVGDLARIEAPIRKLSLGPVAVLDVIVDAAQGE